ncbi:MAG: hypothetical protein LUE26_03405 [Alistipes sp.]|nr:hypothetical protein [Alistipes sp.]
MRTQPKAVGQAVYGTKIVLDTVSPSIGIGLLHLDLNHIRPLFHDMDSGTPFGYLRFMVRPDGPDKGSFLAETAGPVPYRFYEGDSEARAWSRESIGSVYINPCLIFRVLEESCGRYRVVLNEETGDTAVLIEHRGYKPYDPYGHRLSGYHRDYMRREIFRFETWEEYLLRAVSISERGYTPTGSTVAGDTGIRSGKAIEVDGYRVRLESFEGSPPRRRTGWIRWTDGKELLVDCIEIVDH